MTSDAKYERANAGIYRRPVQEGPTTRWMRGATCSHPGCTARIEFPENSNPKPPSVVRNMICNKGWDAGKRGRFFCPDHKEQ